MKTEEPITDDRDREMPVLKREKIRDDDKKIRDDDKKKIRDDDDKVLSVAQPRRSAAASEGVIGGKTTDVGTKRRRSQRLSMKEEDSAADVNNSMSVNNDSMLSRDAAVKSEAVGAVKQDDGLSEHDRLKPHTAIKDEVSISTFQLLYCSCLLRYLST